MTLLFFDLDPLLDDIEAGHPVITPNYRLCHTLQQAYRRHCTALDLGAWRSPAIYALEHWLTDRWQTLARNPLASVDQSVLLLPMQELVIWERIVYESDAGSSLLRPAAAAKLAQSAYRNSLLWELDLDRPAWRREFGEQPDPAAFLEWRDAFVGHCEKHHLLTLPKAAQVLVEAATAGSLPIGRKVVLAGFDLVPPLYGKVLDTLFEDVEEYQHAGSACAARLAACADEEDELRQAAHWARQHWRRNPGQRIAVIVPDLTARRDQVERIFRETFDPCYCLPDKPDRGTVFNLSAGYPLGRSPLVDAALRLLQLNLHKLGLDDLAAILRSPFFADWSAERDLRSKLLVRLRSLGQPDLSPSVLRRLLDSPNAPGEPVNLAARLETFFEKNRQSRFENSAWPDTKSAQLPGVWADLFRQQLKLLGWPGSRSLDSIEYQQAGRWQELLDNFANLDNYLGKVSIVEAISQLQRLAEETVFQPKGGDAVIQVLGLLEAGGLQFDQLWLTGMNDTSWPPPSSPDPLLPVHLQVRFDMPHSSKERELRLAFLQLENLVKASGEMVISYATQIGEETARPARQVATAAPYPLDQCPQGYSLVQDLLGQAVGQLEAVDDSVAPPVNGNERIRGGATVIKNMAQCPFRAFAVHRLAADDLDKPSPGLNAMERGNLVHWAMEAFWQQLGNSANLSASDEQSQNRLIEESLTKALRRLARKRPDLVGKGVLELESARLQNLLSAWIAIERERPDFEVVDCEKRVELKLAGIDFSFQMDRIDRAQEGGLILIDYKTGTVRPGQWLGDRPEEPQLPLYSMAMPIDEPVVALGVGRLRTGDCGFVGLGKTGEELPGASSVESLKDDNIGDWEQLASNWKAVITGLAERFARGEAGVDPANPLKSCQYCTLHGLCRITEDEVCHE
jgi:probable DNA repair protein